MLKSLLLHNLNESVRYIRMHCRKYNLTMQEIRRYVQIAWETCICPSRRNEGDTSVLGIQASGGNDLALEGHKMPRAGMDTIPRPQGTPPAGWSTGPGGDG